MKKLTKYLLMLFVSFFVISCTTSIDTYSKKGKVYRSSDGALYKKNSTIYSTKKVHQKKGKHKLKNYPPGQAKKMWGGKATDYAPGKKMKREH